MKKITVFICLSLFFVFHCIAQKGSFYLGVNNGYNFSNVKILKHSTAFTNNSQKQSYRYGLGIKYELFKNFRIGAEYNVEERGWLIKNTAVYSPTVGSINGATVDYYYPIVSVPLLLDYSIKVKKINFFIEGAYLINTKREGGTIKTNIPNTGLLLYGTAFTPNDAPQKDYAWSFGGGVEINAYKNFILSLSYRKTQNNTDVSTNSLEKDNLRHQSYSYLLQIAYRLHK